jgi:hypothetical protein
MDSAARREIETFACRARLGVCSGGAALTGDRALWTGDRLLPTVFASECGRANTAKRVLFGEEIGPVRHWFWPFPSGVRAPKMKVKSTRGGAPATSAEAERRGPARNGGWHFVRRCCPGGTRPAASRSHPLGARRHASTTRTCARRLVHDRVAAATWRPRPDHGAGAAHRQLRRLARARTVRPGASAEAMDCPPRTPLRGVP